LLLDHQSRVAGLILEQGKLNNKASINRNQSSEVMGILKGQFGLSLIMDLIPLDKKISPGDPVITSGLESDIPAGLLIGYVENIETSPNQLFQKATVQPLADFEGLRIVTILIPEPVEGLQ
jgi:rod shape-determining protein MreC